MFPSSLASNFQTIQCPQRGECRRVFCLFSHNQAQNATPSLNIPLQQPVPSTSTAQPPSLVPTKRAAPPSPVRNGVVPQQGPPRKLQKVAGPHRAFPVPTQVAYTENGVPLLRTSPALSQVPVPVRQTMLKTLFDTFKTLYEHMLSSYPTLAAEHALKQEEEVYGKSTKQTYRVAVIQCVAALKRREKPTSITHLSIGTEDEIKAKREAAESLSALQLSRQLLEPFIHSTEDLKTWGYITEIPEGIGGREPSLEGKTLKCERCSQPFQVKRMEEADECRYHWGKPLSTRSNGERVRIYTCCSRPVTEGDGCVHGPHVFYESAPPDLHARHAFSFLKPPDPNIRALEVAAMDCEMIYTTGGMRVARVSMVDGAGREVFDEFIRMDEGVHVVDYNTRFSGVSQENHATATLSLASARKALDSLINTDTILLGHALDNDLKTMRIIHHRCIDTALLFPHRAGPPYRRSLKDLVREKLGKIIQAGTGDVSVGHSSVEDASATLDLVKWHILNTRKPSTTSA
ncbi:Rexo1 protein [Coprinopsis cinerea okayama7|uniref:Rexo1 protein n=1 Tax=Coprinopsis cinerea (strain Okayama-7 / 130 / ATCC MYA-4618 / FGSC 9003) TaxID=240176 RepID=A8NXS2_COPC7|nr:Rexo1 protein [Coprinopsis cinerea okayama7\|eukprot:XP_001837251.2 Rexo1 protein [Coprinopsis cinerea okayama7\